MTGRNEACPCGSGRKYKHCCERHRPETKQGSGSLSHRLQTALARGQPEEAVVLFEQLLKLQPGQTALQLEYAKLLLGLDRADQAAAVFRQLCLQQGVILREAWVGWGMALRLMGDLDGWIQTWERLLDASPYDRQALLEAGRHALAHARYGSAEKAFVRIEQQEPTDWTAGSSRVYVQNYRADLSDEIRRATAWAWGDQVSQLWQSRWQGHIQPLPRAEPQSILRVGLVSGDLRQHPVGHFIEALLPEIDPTRIQLVVFDHAPQQDDLTGRLRPWVQEWHRLHGLQDEEILACFQGNPVHVLLDLSGHTRHTLLPWFSLRLAQVQVSWLGYWATTGLPAMDYLLADEWVLPSECSHGFRERIYRLPGSYRCFSPPAEQVDVEPTPMLQQGYPVFGSMHHLSKLNEPVLKVWRGILEAIPEARLRIKTHALDTEDDRRVYARYLGRLGFPLARVELAGSSDRRSYLEEFGRMDVLLDPFPFTGGTVSVESLWMGVPVLAMRGHDFVSRSPMNLLGPLNMLDWVADNEDHYIALAVEKTRSAPALNALRQGLRPRLRHSVLMDAHGYAQNWMQAMEQLWQEQLR